MKNAIILTIFFILGGCATAYQPKGLNGGFSSSQLNANVFKVTFSGNDFTTKEKASDFSLLRSAEIALENGFKYFLIVDAQQHSTNTDFTTPVSAITDLNTSTYGSAYAYGNSATYNSNTYGTATTTVTGGETFTFSAPTSSNTIACFIEKPDGFSYNADLTSKSLKTKHGIQDTHDKSLSAPSHSSHGTASRRGPKR